LVIFPQKLHIAQLATIIPNMIKSFKHKGLERFFTTNSTAGIQAQHSKKLKQQLTFLHTATVIEDMHIPNWNLHELKGDKKGIWSITVNKNWRMTFEFIDGNAFIVNYEDYH
jgi:toxin HigB-1